MPNQDAQPIRSSKRGRSRQAATSITRQAIPALALALLGVLTAFALVSWEFLQQGQAQQAQHSKAQHKAYSDYFNGRMIHLRKDVQQAASSNLARAALASTDNDLHLINAEALRQAMSYALRVDIVPKGKAAVDLSADVPITFAGLDVIKRATQREFVGPEVSINPPGLIYAAAPITREGAVAGVLFIVFSKDYWLDPLQKTADEQAGQIVLEQAFDGLAAAAVLQWGTGNAAATTISGPLAAKNLSLKFQPNAAAVTEMGQWVNLLLPLLIALALSLGGIIWAFARLSKRLSADNRLLESNVNRMARGQAVNHEGYAFETNQATAHNLGQILGSSKNSDETDAPDEGASNNTEPAPKKRKRAAAAAAAVASTSLLDDDSDENSVEDLLADLDDPDDDFLEVEKKPIKKASKKASVVEDDNFGISVEEHDSASAADMGVKLDPDIFRAYDIRGITTTNLTAEVVYWIGRAFAAEARDNNMAKVAIGRDGRHSSPELAAGLAKGLTEGGMDVIDIGMVPTPVLYFATHHLKTGTGIMITGSHNPPEYNGLKMMLAGETLAEGRILRLFQRIQEHELSDGAGDIRAVDVETAYLDRILDDVAVAQPKKVVIDCGNGVASELAPKLLEEMGCEVVPLYCEVDGNFPNHHPDPAEPANLADLITVVDAEKADIGLAFDGDGDRLGVVTPRGNIIWPDMLIMLFAQDIISRNPGADIIYDVKCSRHLNHLISESGGRPIMWKTGHSHIKAKMKETGALLGGEFSGHICFGERWFGFDDALYSAARLLEIIGSVEGNVDELFAQFPATFSTPEIKIQTTDKEKFNIMDKLVREGNFGMGAVTSIDGVRVDYDDSWGLIRPSNTSPVLSLRFEADTEDALEEVQERFAVQLERVDPKLKFR